MTTAAAADAAMKMHHFDGWSLDPVRRLLRVNGEPAKVGSRALDVLLVLVQRPGQVVTKDELLALAWPGRIVEENNLSVQIAALRRVLGAERVRNISGVGYSLADQPRPPGPPAPAAASAAASATGHGLVGRDADVQAVVAALGVAALVSVVGMGGVGKSALARAVMAMPEVAQPDGMHWVDLGSVGPEADLLSLVAHRLGVMPQAGGDAPADVRTALAGVQALVVLDNCEHLMDPVCSLLQGLLPVARRVRWLATSQQPLGLAGEHVCRLAPLGVSPPGADAGQQSSCPAMVLFRRRAHVPADAWANDPQALEQASDICRALEGLPLALEIAAARVATLGLQSLRDQLGRRLLLRNAARDAPPRHHSLRDTYAWSYGLLPAAEQALFRRLQPFHGGFTLAQAQQMAQPFAGEAQDAAVDAFDLVHSLLDKSLLHPLARPAPGGAARFTLLEGARDFAALQLAERGETDAALHRHAEIMAALVAEAWDEWLDVRDAAWCEHYLPEQDNLASALAYAQAHDEPALAAVLVTARLLAQSLQQAGADAQVLGVSPALLLRAPPRPRARACVEWGWAHFLHGSRDVGAEAIEQALQDAEALGDRACAHIALTRLVRLARGRPGERAEMLHGWWQRQRELEEQPVPLRLRLYALCTAGRLGPVPTTLEQLQQAGRIAQHAGFEQLAAVCETNVTDELLLQQRYDEVIEVAGQGGDGFALPLGPRGYVGFNVAHALVQRGRADDARAIARRVVRALPATAHAVIDLMARAAVDEGRAGDAALMAGYSTRVKQERGLSPDPAEALLIAQTLQSCRQALAPDELQRLQALGAALGTPEVLALAGLD